MTLPRPLPALPLIGAVLLLQMLALRAMGRPTGCACGADLLWQGAMDPARNSRHLADPYSLLHLGFGIAVFLVLAAMRPHWRRRDLILLVVVSSAIWEAVENLPAVIALFGTRAGDPRAYAGDSLLNSLGDTGFALLGGLVATLLPVRLAIAVIALIEIGVTLAIRDGYVAGLLRATGLA